MNLLDKLTIKNLKLNKKRTIVTVIGIILSVALITAVSSIYSSGIKSLIDFETYEKGDFHVAYYDVPFSEIATFKNNRNIETVNLTMDIGYAKIDSKNEYKPYAFIKAFTKDSLNNLSVRLVDGRLPENENDLLRDMIVWPDNSPEDWHYLSVQEATNSHEFERKPDGIHESWTKLTEDPDWTQY